MGQMCRLWQPRGEQPRLTGFKYSEFFYVMKVIWYIVCIQVNAPSGVPGNTFTFLQGKED